MTPWIKIKGLVLGLSLFTISFASLQMSRAVGPEPEWVTIGLLLEEPSGSVLEDSRTYRGAVLGVEEANVLGGFFGWQFTLSVTHVNGATAAAVAADRLIKKEGVAALISNLGDDAFLAVRSVVQESKVVLLNCSARADSLRINSFPLAYHIEVSNRDYLLALGHFLVSEKKHHRWFLVRGDDSDGEEWEEMVRTFLSGAGGEIAGISALSIQPDGEDIGFNREELEESEASIVVVCLRGELRTAFMDSFGRPESSLPVAMVYEANADDMAWIGSGSRPVYWPSIWSHTLVRYSGRELNSRYRRRFDVLMDSDAWSNWAAVKLVAEAVINRRQANGKIISDFLGSHPPFDGHKGAALTFDLPRRQLCHTLYVLENRRLVDGDIEDESKVVSVFQLVSSDSGTKPIESR